MLGTMALATPSEPPSRLPQIPDHDGGYEPSERRADHHQRRRGQRLPCYGLFRPSRVAVFFVSRVFQLGSHWLGKSPETPRNKPPTPGPHLLAINPAATVMAPPNANLRAYSYHLVFPRAERSRLIFIGLFSRLRTKARRRQPSI